MKSARYKEVSSVEINKWLCDNIPELSEYQKQYIRGDSYTSLAVESPFIYYRFTTKTKVSIIWRLTAILIPLFVLLLVTLSPIKFILTGEFGYSRTLYSKVYQGWCRRAGL